jgi:hypothetical protein
MATRTKISQKQMDILGMPAGRASGDRIFLSARLLAAFSPIH